MASEHRPEPEAPDALRRDLQALFAPRVEVPAATDSRVMDIARRRLMRRPRVLRPIAWVAAAAAGLVAVLMVRRLLPPAADQRERTASAVTDDFDGNGRVDVVDAFALALRLDRGEAVDRRWDLDGDGVVDRRDVDRIARRAVALGGERR